MISYLNESPCSQEDFIKKFVCYCNELNQYYQKLEASTESESEYLANYYLNDNDTYILVYHKDNRLLGFMVVAENSGDNCHPLADYFIEQLWVNDCFRKKNIATELVLKFTKEHSGDYCLDILENNYVAKSFWNSLIESRFKLLDLEEIRDENDHLDLILYGFSTV